MRSLLVGFALVFSSFTAVAQNQRPILFIHGFSPLGLPIDCRHDWEKMQSQLDTLGFKNLKISLAIYANDLNCDSSSSPQGSIVTSISDLSRDLAWYIYDKFSKLGTPVDVVAHSMGGLLVRYALYHVALADANFPPFLKISHVTSMGSPYRGYSVLAEACHINAINLQCDEMDPASRLISHLNTELAMNPQGQDGTHWFNIGSNADLLDNSDGFVTSSSATSMQISASNKVIIPWDKLIFHNSYTRDDDVIKIVAASLNPGSATSRKVFQDMRRNPTWHRPGRLIPIENDQGEPEGFEVQSLVHGGVFEKMGIEEGDIVSGCTPETLGKPFKGLRALEKTKGAKRVQFCLQRNGQDITRVIEIE